MDKAERQYQVNKRWGKKVRRNPTWGRDWLYCFMRHWLTGKFIPLLRSGEIPASFANGAPLPVEIATPTVERVRTL